MESKFLIADFNSIFAIIFILLSIIFLTFLISFAFLTKETATISTSNLLPYFKSVISFLVNDETDKLVSGKATP